MPNILLPVLALAAGTIMMAASGSKAAAAQKDAKKKVATASEAAAKKGDLDRAAALALESGDSKAVKKASDALKKAGNAKAAKELEKKASEAKKAKDAAKKNAEAAKKAKAWQEAIANALASRDPKTVESLAKTLIAAGKTSEAKSLKSAFDALTKELAKAASKPKVDAKPLPKVDAKPKSESKPKVDAKPKPKVDAKPKPKPIATAVSDTKKLEALALVKKLEAGKRYTSTEPKAEVESYQQRNKLDVDGKYGRGTAMSLWTLYQIVPPNPYYWPASGTSAALKDYDAFLQGIAKSKPSVAAKVESLRKTLGR